MAYLLCLTNVDIQKIIINNSNNAVNNTSYSHWDDSQNPTESYSLTDKFCFTVSINHSRHNKDR